MGKRRRRKSGPARLPLGEPRVLLGGEVREAAVRLREEERELGLAVERAGEVVGLSGAIPEDPVEFVERWLEAARGLPGWDGYRQRREGGGRACPVCSDVVEEG